MATTTRKTSQQNSIEQFMRDVDAGLSADEKSIPPKYFYDATGDLLFRKIMALPEYYLTRTEHGILSNYRHEILNGFASEGHFDLVELGAGDGLKTKVLLRHFIGQKANFSYLPVDISANALNLLAHSIASEFPQLSISPIAADYFDALNRLQDGESKKAVLFLGASIGNFTFEQALEFLQQLHASLSPGDVVLIGFDLKKNPAEILAAYNDSQGVTRDFNLNLLHRINRELGGNFEADNFRHYPLYDPQSGEAKSFLVSQTDHSVTIGALGKTFHLKDGETIHTEISRKYSLPEIDLLADLAGFSVIRNFTDPKNRFVNTLWKR